MNAARTSLVGFAGALAAVALVVASAGGAGEGESAAGGPLAPSRREKFAADQTRFEAKGFASCQGTAGQCHGAVGRRPGEDRILGNECLVWRKDGTGPHARAFTILTSERSRRMAKVLGTEAAESRSDCLACHALNVEREKRDPRFQLSYGITCEACHGRSGSWRDEHAGKGPWRKLTSSQKAALGYADLGDVALRAETCLECHLGMGTKAVTHELMAAGHPELTFEFATDLEKVPRHWDHEPPGPLQARLWAVGAAVAFRETMRQLARWAESREKPPLDYTFYDCYACHHELRKRDGGAPDWRAARAASGARVRAGDAPWNAKVLPAARAVVKALLGEPRLAELDAGIAALFPALSLTGSDRAAVAKAAAELFALGESLVAAAERADFGADLARRLLVEVAAAAPGAPADLGFRGAEALYLSAELLHRKAAAGAALPAPARAAVDAALAEMQAALHDLSGKEPRPAPEAFDADRFAAAARRLAAELSPAGGRPAAP